MIARLAAGCALVLATLAAAAGALAAWSAPSRVSAPGEVGAPRVGVDARGTATFAWLRRAGRHSGVEARRRSPGGRLGPVVGLSDPARPADTLDLAVAPGGRVVVVWTSKHVIRARALAADGAPGPAVRIASSASRDASPVVLVAADGDALIAWTQRVRKGTRLIARRWPSAGGLGPAVEIARMPGVASNDDRSVAIAAGGDALFAWVASEGTASRVLTRPWPRSGPPGATTIISPPGSYAQKPHVALAPGGAGVVVWGGDTPDREVVRLLARRRSATGELGPIEELHVGDDNVGLAVAADGTAYVTGSFDIDPEGEVRAATLSPSGLLATTTAVANGFRAVRVAARPGGGALLVWSHNGDREVLARTLSVGGRLGARTRVSPRGGRTRDPALAIAPGGRAEVAWVGGRGRGRRVEAAGGP